MEKRKRKKHVWLSERLHIEGRFNQGPQRLQRKHRDEKRTVVVVVVFTLTDRASTIPSNIRGCQSSTWSQRGTKVNGSHHGDNPLFRPTGIQIATKVMRLYKRWHRPIAKRFTKLPLLHIESSLDRLGLLSPTHDQRSQQQIGQTRSNQF